jgi:hypothetical protein
VSPFSLICFPTECNAVKFEKNDFGEKDVEAVLQRLDRLTHDEARTTATQTLQVVHGLVQNMNVVMDGEQMVSARSVLLLKMLPFRRQSLLRWYP